MVDSFIGQKLKQRRGELNLSLRALGAKSGLSAMFLSQIERGKSNPSLKSLQRIANALGVTLNYFLITKTDTISRNERSQLATIKHLSGDQR